MKNDTFFDGNDLNVEGIGQITGGIYRDIDIKGICTCKGDFKARSISVEGIMKGKGSIESESLDCSGVMELKSSLRTKKINVEGVIKGANKVEANEIICKGGIYVSDGEISADIIDADGIINAKEIVGDNIKIKSHSNIFSDFFQKKFSKIDLIEATTVHLIKVRAKNVSGKDIIIGPKCKIENVDCSGTLVIDKSAEVGNITGNYVLK